MLASLSIFWAIMVFGAQAKPYEESAEEATCGYESCPAYDPEAYNVHIVPHSHDDVGWLKTFDQYYFQDVQFVISSVVSALRENPERRFIQVETAFFKKWWEEQSDVVRQDVIDLVNSGQLEIANGAWSMNDEADTHYQSIIDQYTLGLRYLEDRLGPCSRPKVGWQIDPFGHSREHASINAHLGFDGLFFARIDYRDRAVREATKTQDLLWRASENLGNTSDIFTSVLYEHYSSPSGFCFDIVCGDDPIIDDADSPDYNYEQRVKDFVDVVQQRAVTFPTNNLMVVIGDDFRYESAITTYTNLDRLIKGFELFPQTYQDQPIKLYYSTPSCYTKAVNEYVHSNNYTLQLKTDDFLSYAIRPGSYLTGFYTSRPASKRFERQGNNLLQVAKQLAAAGQPVYNNPLINSLKEALGVMQHHDAITGTEQQHVADNYYLILSKAMSYVDQAVDFLLSILTGNYEDFELSSCLLANMSYCPQTKADRFQVVVYNPLSRTVATAVSLPVDWQNWRIYDPDGVVLEPQYIDPIRDFSYATDFQPEPKVLVFWAENLQPLGFNIYTLERYDPERQESVQGIENDPSPNPSSGYTESVGKLQESNVIGYEDANIELDDTGRLKKIALNGLELEVSQDLLYYTSQSGSGAYVFLPQREGPNRTGGDSVDITIVTGDVWTGVVQKFSDWATQTIKIYNGERTYVEFEWVVGPLDSSRVRGQEVISRFSTSLNTEGVFYTDSNGREMIKRVRNYRETYEYTDEEPVSGNYFPVNTRIALRDREKNVSFSLITDRSLGGSSLEDGQVELMLHRACYDDYRMARGTGENLNEQQYYQGIVVRGQLYVMMGETDGDGQRSIVAMEKDLAQRKTLAPWVFVTNKDVSETLPIQQWGNLKRDLPENVQITTLEPWQDGTLLLRLEHVLEKNDDPDLSQEVTVDLSDLFLAFTINGLQETTLAGNIPLDEVNRLEWPGSEELGLVKPRNGHKRDAADFKITLGPMEIRTFLAKVTRNL